MYKYSNRYILMVHEEKGVVVSHHYVTRVVSFQASFTIPHGISFSFPFQSLFFHLAVAQTKQYTEPLRLPTEIGVNVGKQTDAEKPKIQPWVPPHLALLVNRGLLIQKFTSSQTGGKEGNHENASAKRSCKSFLFFSQKRMNRAKC